MSRPTIGFRVGVLSKSPMTINQITIQYDRVPASPDGAVPTPESHVFYDTSSGALAVHNLLDHINTNQALYRGLSINTRKVPV